VDTSLSIEQFTVEASNETKTRSLLDMRALYTIESLLSQGTTAKVYRAHTQAGQAVALKVLTAESAGQPQLLKLFHSEYTFLSRLCHDGLVRGFEYGEVNGLPAQSMTYIAGQTLDVFLSQQGRLDETMAVDITRQLAITLAYVHMQQIVHRDVKPANVMLTPNKKTVLFDFGAALDLSTADEQDSSKIYGTPAFLAPEQIIGHHNLDGRADLYGLGVMLYRMVTGRKPFYGSRQEVLDAHLTQLPLAPSQFVHVSPELEQLIIKALAKQPAMRFQSGSELADALAHVQLMPAPKRFAFFQPWYRWFNHR